MKKKEQTKKKDDKEKKVIVDDTQATEVHRHMNTLTNERPFYTAPNGVLWHYDAMTGIWKDNADTLIRSIVGRSLSGSMRYRSRIVNEVLKGIQDTHYNDRIELGCTSHIIVCANGRIDVTTGKFSPFHKHDEYHITRIPVEYDPESTCRTFEMFLTEVIDNEDDRLAIIEFFGYCLLKSYPMATIPILLGGGANGKSTLLGVLRELLGDDNISGSSIQELSENKFRSAQLYGKLANICADLPSRTVRYSGIIKQLTGNDMTEGEKKGQDSFTFQNHAKLIFSANTLPPTMDDSLAFYRRMRIIEFPHMFDVTDPQTDPHMLSKMTSKSSMSGVLNMAIAGLMRMMKNGKMTGEMSAIKKRLSYIKMSNSVQYFADTFIEKYHKSEVPIANHEMYEWYIRVCDMSSVVPVGIQRFTGELRRFISYADFQRSTIEGVRQSRWYGCALRMDVIMGMEDGEID